MIKTNNKTKTKDYIVHDNGGRPFKVSIDE